MELFGSRGPLGARCLLVQNNGAGNTVLSITEPTSVRDLQDRLFPPMAPTENSNDLDLPRLSTNPFLNNVLLNNNKILLGEERSKSALPRMRTDHKELFALPKDFTHHSHQSPRWPAECQVLNERVEHIPFVPSVPERFYTSHGKEVQPKPLGEDFGTVVYQYYPVSALNYGGNKVNNTVLDIQEDDLRFESRFECGNLAKAIKLTATFYELYVRSDLYTNRFMQWYYFRIDNVKKLTMYRFSIVNLSKNDSLYMNGMRPLMYSTKDAKLHSIGWRRCGENIVYFCNDNGNTEDDQPVTYTLSFTMDFPHDNDTVYLAHSYPYTYTDLQEYLTGLVNHPIKSQFCSLRLLCRSLAGNNVYYVTVTTPHQDDEIKHNKKAIVVTARVHPGESPSSWMMKGLIDFITGDSTPARDLRDKFIFKIVPMLNPDGVIVGNSRCSLTGRDLNRQYRTVIRETYPSIWYTKLMIRRLMEDCGVAMYCDFHAHSRQNNIFIYGCENRKINERYLSEQVFPLMLHKNAADKFSFQSCKFKIQKAKEGTGRVVMWMMGINNSYTLEASFAGTDLGARADTHFSVVDYEQMGRSFCQTLLDFYDEAPHKEKLRFKILKRLLKEGSTAEEPTNIVLSDYSSDEGDSSSYDEGCDSETFKQFITVPPPSPVLHKPSWKKKVSVYKTPVANKSPNANRKLLPMYRTTVGLTLAEADSSGESETENYYYAPLKQARLRTQSRKPARQKKVRRNKLLVQQDHSDTELFKHKRSGNTYTVVNVNVNEKTRSQSWSRSPSGYKVSRGTDIRTIHQKTFKQLSEVQNRLLTLRHRIWSGIEDTYTKPLSWGFSNVSSSTTSLINKFSTKGSSNNANSSKVRDFTSNKKSKAPIIITQEKSDKKPKKKSKRVEETKKQQQQQPPPPPPKKKSSGLKRQAAMDLGPAGDNYRHRHPIVNTKNMKKITKTVPCKHFIPSKVSTETEDANHKLPTKLKKKKKRSGNNWEKKIKTVKTVNAFIRKKSVCPNNVC